MTKISAYTSLTSPQGDDVLPVVDVHDTTMASSGTTKKITVANLLNVIIVARPTGVAATDTANINTAITAWKAAGNGILQFQEGTYITNGGHAAGGGYPGGGIIQGTGWNTVIQLANSVNAYIFDLGSAGSPQYTPGLTIREIYLDCNGANQATGGGGVYARGAIWCVFDHVWFETPWEAGIRFYQDGTGSYGHHNTIRDCLFRDGRNSNTGHGWAIKFEQSDENLCTGCTFQDCGRSVGDGHDAQIYDTSAGLQTFQGCNFVGGATGAAQFKSDSGPSRITFTGTRFDSGVAANQVELNGPGSTIDACQFLNFPGVAVHLNNNNCRVVSSYFASSGSSTATAVLEDSGGDYNLIAQNTWTGTYLSSAPLVTAGAHTVTANNITH
jgi:hypothetical protein